jgi:hypothetical protein
VRWREQTSRPFAVNFIIETTAFGPLTTEAHIEVCVEQRVPDVAFFWTTPPDGWMRKLNEAICDVCRQEEQVVRPSIQVSSDLVEVNRNDTAEETLRRVTTFLRT